MVGQTTHKRGGRSWAAWMTAAVVFGVAVPAWGQPEKLPTAEEVLDKAVDALGGKAALEKHRNRVSKGTFEIPAMGQKGTLHSFEAEPNKYYQVIELPGGLKVESGSDGEVYWDVQPQGARILEGEEKAFKERDSRFNGPLHWRTLYKTVECVGIEKVDEQPCYKVVMTPERGAPQTIYYDTDSYLALRMDVVLKTPQGPIQAELRFADYKKVDGVRLPHKLTQKMLGMEQVMSIETIECNAEIPAERFALPQPVKALVEQSKATTKPAEAEKEKP